MAKVARPALPRRQTLLAHWAAAAAPWLISMRRSASGKSPMQNAIAIPPPRRRIVPRPGRWRTDFASPQSPHMELEASGDLISRDQSDCRMQANEYSFHAIPQRLTGLEENYFPVSVSWSILRIVFLKDF